MAFPIIRIFVCLGATTVFLHYVFLYDDSFYPTFFIDWLLLPEYPRLRNATLLIQGGVLFLIFQSVWHALVFFVLAFTLYITPMISMIFKDLLPREKNYRMRAWLRTYPVLLNEYTRLELMHNVFNQLVAPGIIPFQSIVTQISLFCSCTLILSWNRLDIVTRIILILWEIGIIFLQSMILELGGRLHSQSKKVLKEWKYLNWRPLSKRILNKFRKSRRPIALRAGQYHSIKRLSILKFYKGLIRGTFRAILSIGKQSK